ncbi:MAG: PASTA domain-containing protein, partial [Pseudomonadota bacterium]
EGSSNGEVTTNSDTIVFIARKENDAYIASGLVFDFQDIGLVYSGEEVSTEATPGSHSFEVVNEIGATTPDQTIVKEPRDDDNKTNVDEPDEVNENNSDQTGSDVSDEIASANSSDVGHQSIGDTDASTSKLNPNNPEISRLISQWIRLAKPPSNATHGHDYRYEKWGRFIGTNVDGVIVTANQKPQDAKGKSSMEYVWGKKDKLDSVDHCTLGKYVESSVRGKSLDDCKGRYKPIVPNMVGMPFQLATERLSKLQLTPELKAGTPAPSTEKSKTIERQSIEVGSTLDRGDSISIWIHTPYVEKIEVPNLLGRTFADAKSEIESLGLNLKIEIGDSAEDKDSEGAVQSQAPRPGTIVKIESLITLKLFSPPVNSLTSPNVVGMTRSEALALLKSQGFRVTIIDGSTTIDYESQGRVEAQIPPAGSRIKKDGKIILAIFSTPEYQRIVGDYVGRELESVRSELKSEGLDIQVFMGDMATSQDANWTVQNQTPIPGSRAKVGETVELTLFTKFVETATIPNVEGMSVSQAKSTIEKEGLAVRFSIGAQAPNSQKSGKVISSNPPEGNSVKLGSTVSLSVYAAFIDTVVIPRLQGKTGSEAKRTLDKAGFDVQFKIGQSAPYSSKAGTVISTNPTEGLTVKPGTTVEVTVYANAVQTIRVPNVIGRYGSAATRQIQGMGLKATIKYAGPAESQADVNKVIRQSPSGNSVAAAGTTIILEILAQVDSQASQSAAASQSNTSSSVKKHACGDSTVPYTGSFTSFQSSGHSSSRIRQMKGDDVACVFSTVSPGYFSITDLSVTFWYCKSDFSSCGPASEFHPIRHIENGNGYRDYHHDRGWFRISPY